MQRRNYNVNSAVNYVGPHYLENFAESARGGSACGGNLTGTVLGKVLGGVTLDVVLGNVHDVVTG
jgi:hypothetical protein